MKFTLSTITFLALTSKAAADLCAWDTLLGLGSLTTLPYKFNLVARDDNGTTYPIVRSSTPEPGSFFFGLSLGAESTPLSDASVPSFQLQGETAYADNGLVASTQGIPLLGPLPVYVSSDNRQYEQGFQAVNVTCADKQQLSLRFTNLLPLPLASAAVNNTFAPGSALLSPILDGLLSEFILWRYEKESSDSRQLCLHLWI